MVITKLDVLKHMALQPLRLLTLRAKGVSVGRNVKLAGSPIVTRNSSSEITLGEGVTLVSRSKWTALGVSRPTILRTLAQGASITIGANSGLSGTTICAVVAVEIGERVLIGADVVIADTDFHPLDAMPRAGAAIPAGSQDDRVVIESDSFIGARAIILKGVTIGVGSVVGAGSVVTKDVPPGCIVAGNPARVLRRLSGARVAGQPSNEIDRSES
jgi:acetyltransferase-like isoleucine patch superfamily enzyme